MTGSRNGRARKSLWENGHHYCAYCGILLTIKHGENNMLTVDHKTPRVEGGKTSWYNILSACVKCNGKKADRNIPQKFSTKSGRPI